MNHLPIPPLTALRLPFLFDAQKLDTDLSVALAQQWKSHYNSADYAGDWKIIALRSENGREDSITSKDLPDYHDTPLMALCPYFREIADGFRCEKQAIRLMQLAPAAASRNTATPAELCARRVPHPHPHPYARTGAFCGERPRNTDAARRMLVRQFRLAPPRGKQRQRAPHPPRVRTACATPGATASSPKTASTSKPPTTKPPNRKTSPKSSNNCNSWAPTPPCA